jgi:hypothetical protein
VRVRLAAKHVAQVAMEKQKADEAEDHEREAKVREDMTLLGDIHWKTLVKTADRRHRLRTT